MYFAPIYSSTVVRCRVYIASILVWLTSMNLAYIKLLLLRLLLLVLPFDWICATLHRIYHKSFDADKFNAKETKLLWERFDNLKPNTQYVFYVVAISERNDETSRPSEKIVVWTDPAVSPIVDVSIPGDHICIFCFATLNGSVFRRRRRRTIQPPTIHPDEIITEGSSMTVLCVALGDPMPKISLYVGGIEIKSEITRQMVTTVQNITIEMVDVTCYAGTSTILFVLQIAISEFRMHFD